MVNVDIDADLYEDIKSIVKQNRLDYPSIRHFVQKMLDLGKSAWNTYLEIIRKNISVKSILY